MYLKLIILGICLHFNKCQIFLKEFRINVQKMGFILKLNLKKNIFLVKLWIVEKQIIKLQ